MKPASPLPAPFQLLQRNAANVRSPPIPAEVCSTLTTVRIGSRPLFRRLPLPPPPRFPLRRRVPGACPHDQFQRPDLLHRACLLPAMMLTSRSQSRACGPNRRAGGDSGATKLPGFSNGKPLSRPMIETSRPLRPARHRGIRDPHQLAPSRAVLASVDMPWTPGGKLQMRPASISGVRSAGTAGRARP